jgi:hypothetical protein
MDDGNAKTGAAPQVENKLVCREGGPAGRGAYFALPSHDE